MNFVLFIYDTDTHMISNDLARKDLKKLRHFFLLFLSI